MKLEYLHGVSHIPKKKFLIWMIPPEGFGFFFFFSWERLSNDFIGRLNAKTGAKHGAYDVFRRYT